MTAGWHGVPSAAAALAAAALCQPLQTSEAALLEKTLFARACSCRIALPLGRGVALLSGDLRAGPPTYLPTPSLESLIGVALVKAQLMAVEGEAACQYFDLRVLKTAECANSFLCLPVLTCGGDEHAVAALLLSYTSTADAPQEELRLALLVANELSRNHSGKLQEHAARMCNAVSPSEETEWGPGIDASYPALSSSSCSSDEEDDSCDSDRAGASSLAATRSGLPHGHRHRRRPAELTDVSRAPDWAFSPFTLRFSDSRLEKQFREWRNHRLARVDCMALLSLLAHNAASILLPPVGRSPTQGLSATLIPIIATAIPLLVLALSRSKGLYSRHRDTLLTLTYVVLAWHNALHMFAQHQSAPPAVRRAAIVRLELTWWLVLGLILQLQFAGQCALVIGSLVMEVVLQPRRPPFLLAGPRNCPALAQGVFTAGACVVSSTARALLLRVALPCALSYYMELAARRAFCRTLTGATGHAVPH